MRRGLKSSKLNYGMNHGVNEGQTSQGFHDQERAEWVQRTAGWVPAQD